MCTVVCSCLLFVFCIYIFLLVFFFKQKTAYEMRISDWSSDVCSSVLLIVGLAPGLRGANRTGRPFTGDYAGDLLYPTLLAFGFASGRYGQDPADGLLLDGCRITNAVRCVPPQNDDHSTMQHCWCCSGDRKSTRLNSSH